MDFELIVAVTHRGVIGKNNKIPWYIPEDLKHFKKITLNSIVVMGRKTFESLPNGPLPNRMNIVLTRTPNNANNIDNLIFTNIDNLFTIIKQYHNRVFVIGGSEIYLLLLSYCKVIHMTLVYEDIDGDRKLSIPLESNYEKIDESEIMYSKNNNHRYQYVTYSKLSDGA
jgi:dihydrofolate reductase